MMVVGLALFALAILLRSLSANRHVRGRLVGSAIVFAVYTAIAAALTYGGESFAALRPQLSWTLPLLLAFGVINAAVAVAINPWRVDRLPDRFPTIVQDAIGIGLFALVATLILQDRIFATSAVGAVVIGLALQETLGNLFAGLAVQIEKPFRVGQWVNIAGKDGLVTEVTWRSTKIKTKPGNFVIVPNSALARDTITNYSEPTDETRIEVEVGASYDAPPNFVKATIIAAVKDEPLILSRHSPEVLIVDFAASAITYRIRVWTREFALDEVIRDRVQSAVYYAFRRSGIVIPYPIQVNMLQGELAPAAPDRAAVETTLRGVAIFSALSDAQYTELAQAATLRLYAAREVVVRQSEAGSSMFVVATGEVSVTLEPSGTEVAHLGPGDHFGEMSLLTGEARTATVTAASDSELLEITADAFRRFVLENPAVVEQVSVAVAARAAQLDVHRMTGAPTAAPEETPQSLIARVRRFLRVAASEGKTAPLWGREGGEP
jgi:small-conductance mechanosensitive channel/CRP-like cAMP-binding protein